MSLVTGFDDLTDLVLIELFSYLSSTDILWAFTNLNHQLTMLITERNFFSNINLSNSRYDQFNRIIRYLPLDNILLLSIDSDASPLQLTLWPYLPRLRTLRIFGAYNYDHLLLFLLLHAATLNNLIIKPNERLIPDGSTLKFDYPRGTMLTLINNFLFIHLPSLRSLDLGMDYYITRWPMTGRIVPLNYLRLSLPNINVLIRLMSTSPLNETLRELHIKIGNSLFNGRSRVPIPDLSVKMINLRRFTLVQTFFSMLTIEWKIFDMLTSSKIMPVLRHANVSIFININDLNSISSSSIFNDYRHVDVNFAFHLINCHDYIKVSQYIPNGNYYHTRETIGATFIVNGWSQRSQWITDEDPFIRGREYKHHMWYTLPWSFDELFHEYVPYRWITKAQVFKISSNLLTVHQSSLRTLDASGQTLSSSICILPQVVLYDSIETLHLSYSNRYFSIDLSNLRNITLVNSINCLNGLLFSGTIHSIRILQFLTYPNYKSLNWPTIYHSLSTLRQLSSLRIFMYDLLTDIDDKNCEIIAKMASLVIDFGFCFRYKFSSTDADVLTPTFKIQAKSIKQICHYMLLSVDNHPYYSVEDDGCGIFIWF
ncbi:unnamed protein product [Rotaria sp. Silwood2]|nr:unnamed protein product [Rotaria sp. Silwood2]CAF4457138.1 unnamed protein product [Rotaria sp. Silwood2]